MGDSCGKDSTSEEYPCHRLITSSGYASAALLSSCCGGAVRFIGSGISCSEVMLIVDVDCV